jgi:hypothetical protein
MTYQKRKMFDAFLSGVLVSLEIVYAGGQETCAEEIVEAVGPYALLRVAKKEEDPCLCDLRRTAREVLRLRKSYGKPNI